MKHRVWLVLAVGFLLAADSKDDDVKKELKKLDGTWAVTAFTMDGNKVPEDDAKKIKVILQGTKYTLKQEDNDLSKGTFKIDPGKKPKTIDITPEGEGSAMLGIYELDGDTYKVCYAPAGKDRPTKFTSESGTEHVLFVFKRAKP